MIYLKLIESPSGNFEVSKRGICLMTELRSTCLGHQNIMHYVSGKKKKNTMPYYYSVMNLIRLQNNSFRRLGDTRAENSRLYTAGIKKVLLDPSYPI